MEETYTKDSLQNGNRNDEPEQLNRAFLRENFLKTMNYLNGNDCTISMHSDTEVTCVYKTSDALFENVAVENLKTPIGHTLPKAILRTNDIISISFILPSD